MILMAANSTSGKQRYILGRIFLLANRLQVLGDQIVAEDMTIRQWLLTAGIAQYKKPPSLNEISEAMGSSHQNVKQLVMKLKEKGFLRIERDIEDKRAICFILEDKCFEYCERRREEITQFLSKLFEDMTPDEIDLLNESVNKLYKALLKK